MTTLREAYDLIDRFLRNNLYDDDYAEYSEALELLSSEPPQQQAAPFSPDSISTAQTAWKMGYEAAKAEMAEQAQPVAWINKHGHIDRGLDAILDPTGWTPLYTSPPQRKPLTDKQIGAILEDPNIAELHQGNWLVLPYAYARAIEREHGIGSKE